MVKGFDTTFNENKECLSYACQQDSSRNRQVSRSVWVYLRGDTWAGFSQVVEQVFPNKEHELGSKPSSTTSFT
jgi:hypothetical protein